MNNCDIKKIDQELRYRFDTFVNNDVEKWIDEINRQGRHVYVQEIAMVFRFSNWIKLQKEKQDTMKPDYKEVSDKCKHIIAQESGGSLLSKIEDYEQDIFKFNFCPLCGKKLVDRAYQRGLEDGKRK